MISKKTYKIRCGAKINIGLRVLSGRRDGYHNIETIFYPVNNFYDIITLSAEPSEITRINVKVINYKKENLDNENNICHKAVTQFIKNFNIKNNYSFKIKINKRIPVGSGLGGGSSNAAAVLNLLSRYFNKEKNKTALRKTALKLGSDVPFFLCKKPAYACGRGEIIKILPEFRINYKIVIASPGVPVSTVWAYNNLKIKNDKSKTGKKLNSVKTFSLFYKNKFVNDFEKVVFKKYPAIKKLKQKMYDEGAVFASMSGSGSAVYGFFRK